MKSSRTITLAGTALLLLVTPLLFCPFTEDIFLLPKTVFLLAVGAPLAAAYFLSRLGQGRRYPKTMWMFAALLLFAVEGVAFSRVPALSAAAALPYLVACGFFAAVAGTQWTEKEIRFLLLLVCCAALATSVYSIVAFFGADPIFGKIPRLAETADERKVIRGFLGHADFVGAFLAITLPLTGAFFLAEKKPLAKAAALATSALTLSAILLTMTRASWLATVAAAAFFIVCLSIRGGWRLFLKFSAGGAALLVLFFLFFSAFGVSEGETLLTRLFTIPDARHSANTGRIAFWGVALAAWERSPATGHGLGAFAYIYPKIQPEFIARRGEELELTPAMNVAYAHNDYLQAAAENGAAGLLLLGAVAAGVFFMGLRRVAGGEKRGALLAAGALSALVAALVDAVFMFPFRLAATGVYIAFAAGLAVSLGGNAGYRVSDIGYREKEKDLSTKDTKNTKKINIKPRRAAVMLCAALSIVAIAAVWLAAWRAAASDALLLHAPDKPYIERLRRARELNPFDGEISYRIGSELFNTGNYEESLAEFKRAEKYYDSAALHAYEYKIYSRLGDDASAQRHAKLATGNGLPPDKLGR